MLGIRNMDIGFLPSESVDIHPYDKTSKRR
jgi:hypothetical protein